MSWRKALWEKVSIGDDDVTVLDRETEEGFGAFEEVEIPNENRRAEPRYTADEVPAITGLQLAGEAVRLINISSSGVLVESSSRFKPGERVRISITGLTPNLVSSVVVRCVVSAISTGGKLQYESGIAFAQRVSLPLGPAALRTSAEALQSAPPDESETATGAAAVAFSVQPEPPAPPPAAAALPAAALQATVIPGVATLPAAAADARRALPRVRNRW